MQFSEQFLLQPVCDYSGRVGSDVNHSLMLKNATIAGPRGATQLQKDHLQRGKSLEESIRSKHPAIKPRSEPAPSKNGRLRVGLLGLFNSPVMRFLVPLFANRDKQRVLYTLYATDDNDSARRHLDHRNLCDRFHSVPDWYSARKICRLIARDEIDVLVDISGRSKDHRLDVFALRAAPTQVTYLGYPNTSGLPSMDFRLTDALVDPPRTRQLHSETLARFPDDMPFLCFDPNWKRLTCGRVIDADGDTKMAAADNQQAATSTTPTPALKHPSKYVTFGVFNNPIKINDVSLRCWAEILKRVPHGRILFQHSKLGKSEAVKPELRKRLLALGVGENRFLARVCKGSQEEHLSTYAEVDIALDTWPYSGTTTTIDALCSGVPVVTLLPNYDNHCARVTASFLMRLPKELVEQHGLIAHTTAEYVSAAVRLAKLPAKELNALRQKLRPAFLQSPLCDTKGAASAFSALLTQLHQQRFPAHSASLVAEARASPQRKRSKRDKESSAVAAVQRHKRKRDFGRGDVTVSKLRSSQSPWKRRLRSWQRSRQSRASSSTS